MASPSSATTAQLGSVSQPPPVGPPRSSAVFLDRSALAERDLSKALTDARAAASASRLKIPSFDAPASAPTSASVSSSTSSSNLSGSLAGGAADANTAGAAARARFTDNGLALTAGVSRKDSASNSSSTSGTAASVLISPPLPDTLPSLSHLKATITTNITTAATRLPPLPPPPSALADSLADCTLARLHSHATLQTLHLAVLRAHADRRAQAAGLRRVCLTRMLLHTQSLQTFHAAGLPLARAMAALANAAAGARARIRVLTVSQRHAEIDAAVNAAAAATTAAATSSSNANGLKTSAHARAPASAHGNAGTHTNAGSSAEVASAAAAAAVSDNDADTAALLSSVASTVPASALHSLAITDCESLLMATLLQAQREQRLSVVLMALKHMPQRAALRLALQADAPARGVFAVTAPAVHTAAATPARAPLHFALADNNSQDGNSTIRAPAKYPLHYLSHPTTPLPAPSPFARLFPHSNAATNLSIFASPLLPLHVTAAALAAASVAAPLPAAAEGAWVTVASLLVAMTADGTLAATEAAAPALVPLTEAEAEAEAAAAAGAGAAAVGSAAAGVSCEGAGAERNFARVRRWAPTALAAAAAATSAATTISNAASAAVAGNAKSGSSASAGAAASGSAAGVCALLALTQPPAGAAGAVLAWAAQVLAAGYDKTPDALRIATAGGAVGAAGLAMPVPAPRARAMGAGLVRKVRAGGRKRRNKRGNNNKTGTIGIDGVDAADDDGDLGLDDDDDDDDDGDDGGVYLLAEEDAYEEEDEADGSNNNNDLYGYVPAHLADAPASTITSTHTSTNADSNSAGSNDVNTDALGSGFASDDAVTVAGAVVPSAPWPQPHSAVVADAVELTVTPFVPLPTPEQRAQQAGLDLEVPLPWPHATITAVSTTTTTASSSSNENDTSNATVFSAEQESKSSSSGAGGESVNVTVSVSVPAEASVHAACAEAAATSPLAPGFLWLDRVTADAPAAEACAWARALATAHGPVARARQGAAPGPVAPAVAAETSESSVESVVLLQMTRIRVLQRRVMGLLNYARSVQKNTVNTLINHGAIECPNALATSKCNNSGGGGGGLAAIVLQTLLTAHNNDINNADASSGDSPNDRKSTDNTDAGAPTVAAAEQALSALKSASLRAEDLPLELHLAAAAAMSGGGTAPHIGGRHSSLLGLADEVAAAAAGNGSNSQSRGNGAMDSDDDDYDDGDANCGDDLGDGDGCVSGSRSGLRAPRALDTYTVDTEDGAITVHSSGGSPSIIAADGVVAAGTPVLYSAALDDMRRLRTHLLQHNLRYLSHLHSRQAHARARQRVAAAAWARRLEASVAALAEATLAAGCSGRSTYVHGPSWLPPFSLFARKCVSVTSTNPNASAAAGVEGMCFVSLNELASLTSRFASSPDTADEDAKSNGSDEDSRFASGYVDNECPMRQRRSAVAAAGRAVSRLLAMSSRDIRRYRPPALPTSTSPLSVTTSLATTTPLDNTNANMIATGTVNNATAAVAAASSSSSSGFSFGTGLALRPVPSVDAVLASKEAARHALRLRVGAHGRVQRVAVNTADAPLPASSTDATTPAPTGAGAGACENDEEVAAATGTRGWRAALATAVATLAATLAASAEDLPSARHSDPRTQAVAEADAEALGAAARMGPAALAAAEHTRLDFETGCDRLSLLLATWEREYEYQCGKKALLDAVTRALPHCADPSAARDIARRVAAIVAARPTVDSAPSADMHVVSGLAEREAVENQQFFAAYFSGTGFVPASALRAVPALAEYQAQTASVLAATAVANRPEGTHASAAAAAATALPPPLPPVFLLPFTAPAPRPPPARLAWPLAQISLDATVLRARAAALHCSLDLLTDCERAAATDGEPWRAQLAASPAAAAAAAAVAAASELGLAGPGGASVAAGPRSRQSLSLRATGRYGQLMPPPVTPATALTASCSNTTAAAVAAAVHAARFPAAPLGNSGVVLSAVAASFNDGNGSMLSSCAPGGAVSATFTLYTPLETVVYYPARPFDRFAPICSRYTHSNMSTQTSSSATSSLGSCRCVYKDDHSEMYTALVSGSEDRYGPAGWRYAAGTAESASQPLSLRLLPTLANANANGRPNATATAVAHATLASSAAAAIAVSATGPATAGALATDGLPSDVAAAVTAHRGALARARARGSGYEPASAWLQIDANGDSDAAAAALGPGAALGGAATADEAAAACAAATAVVPAAGAVLAPPLPAPRRPAGLVELLPALAAVGSVADATAAAEARLLELQPRRNRLIWPQPPQPPRVYTFATRIVAKQSDATAPDSVALAALSPLAADAEARALFAAAATSATETMYSPEPFVALTRRYLDFLPLIYAASVDYLLAFTNEAASAASAAAAAADAADSAHATTAFSSSADAAPTALSQSAGANQLDTRSRLCPTHNALTDAPPRLQLQRSPLTEQMFPMAGLPALPPRRRALVTTAEADAAAAVAAGGAPGRAPVAAAVASRVAAASAASAAKIGNKSGAHSGWGAAARVSVAPATGGGSDTASALALGHGGRMNAAMGVIDGDGWVFAPIKGRALTRAMLASAVSPADSASLSDITNAHSNKGTSTPSGRNAAPVDDMLAQTMQSPNEFCLTRFERSHHIAAAAVEVLRTVAASSLASAAPFALSSGHREPSTLASLWSHAALTSPAIVITTVRSLAHRRATRELRAAVKAQAQALAATQAAEAALVSAGDGVTAGGAAGRAARKAGARAKPPPGNDANLSGAIASAVSAGTAAALEDRKSVV